MTVNNSQHEAIKVQCRADIYISLFFSCCSYPNPKEWTLENIPGRKHLDQITVKDITLALKTPYKGINADVHRRLIPWTQNSQGQGVGGGRS